MTDSPIRHALISVSDKLGLGGFARGLYELGVKIYSTGGTARFLRNEQVPVNDLSEYTGFPELLEGRLKTLHPKVFGGILGRHDREDDQQALAEHGIQGFELVVVNLYPFESTIAREGVTDAEAIEQIDIGGPSLVRAAAKNHKFVTVATSPEQYAAVLQQVKERGSTTYELRRRLAAAAFSSTAAYDRAIADYFCTGLDSDEPPVMLTLPLRRMNSLRYGENPHQQAAVYGRADAAGANLLSARQLNGKELSYNNLLDLDSALAVVRSFSKPAVTVIKHNNPCGVAEANELETAARNALDGDPLSAFGSVLGFNRTVDIATAKLLATPGLFIEAIVAPGFEEAALEVLTTEPKWKANVRLMEVGDLNEPREHWNLRQIEGGMLLQSADVDADPRSRWQVATKTEPSDQQRRELEFAWDVVRHVKSNAIVLCKDFAMCGAGAGQMSRVDSVQLAIDKAGGRAVGAVMASDAFFPFPDSIHKAAEAGVAAIVQPGGSRKDDEVIAACDQLGIAMVFTGRRQFKH